MRLLQSRTSALDQRKRRHEPLDIGRGLGAGRADVDHLVQDVGLEHGQDAHDGVALLDDEADGRGAVQGEALFVAHHAEFGLAGAHHQAAAALALAQAVELLLRV